MAALAPPADQAAELLQKLSLDSQAKTLEITEPTKKPANQYGTVVSGDTPNGQIQPYERSLTPILPEFVDPTMCYLPNGYPSTYYYGGYDSAANEWEEYHRYVNPDGMEMPPGVYGDNGSMMYHHGYSYAPYSPYSPAGSPVPTLGHDGQLYGTQHYQYPTPYFQPMAPTNGTYNTNSSASTVDLSASAAPDQKSLSVEAVNGNSNSIVNGGGLKTNNGSALIKPSYQNSTFNSNNSFGRGTLSGGIPSSGYQDPRYGFDSVRSSFPWLDGSVLADGHARSVTTSTTSSPISTANNNPASRNQSFRPHSHLVGLHQPRPLSGMGAAHGYMNRIYPNKMFGQYGNGIRSPVGYGSSGYDSRTGRGWLGIDNKFKPRGRGNGFYGYGNENIDGLNELNRGPRAKGGSKSLKVFAPVALAVKGQNLILNRASDDEDKDKSSLVPDREQYNLADFSVEYAEAKFFIIKSYSEDDVHKSIKYSVWASTPNGNKKLDAAYKEAQEKSKSCPVFLFFSVNTSGQFVGLAEMVGPVDFNTNVEYWQQDKWNGCFSVKWHVVKDVPNNLLKHITLENNENKPVTNSRDTQEVKLEQGIQMLKIFKDHSSKTCILDDFCFYEGRQKTIQDRKAKQQQFQKQSSQVWEGKSIEEMNKDGVNGEPKFQNSLEVSADLTNNSSPVGDDGECRVSENLSVGKTGDMPNGAKLGGALEKSVLSNGVANCC